MNIHPSLLKMVLGLSAISGMAGVVFSSQSRTSTPNKANGAKVAATPRPPSAAEMSRCLDFSRPVKLQVSAGGAGLFAPPKAIWSRSYSSSKQTLYTYEVELYKGRSMMGSKRAEEEKRIEESVLESKKRWAEIYKGKRKYEERPYKMIDFEIRPGGRKVFFTAFAFGPGGAIMGVFTTIGKYDLLLVQSTDFEDDMPDEKRLKNSAEPRKTLSQTFKQLEKIIPHLTGS